MASFTTKRVEDLDTLKAVSHPLRLQALGTLRRKGPQTASELGRELGESSGSMSYHLRQLERFGFVDDDVEQPSGRERRWRALHDMTSLPSSLASLEGGRVYLDAVRRRQEEHLREDLDRWTEHRPGLGHSDYSVQIDSDDLEALLAEIDEVVARYADHSGADRVNLHVLALPGRPTG